MRIYYILIFVVIEIFDHLVYTKKYKKPTFDKKISMKLNKNWNKFSLQVNLALKEKYSIMLVCFFFKDISLKLNIL